MNTGAILNRINFGLSLAAGQIPGAQLANWPDFDVAAHAAARATGGRGREVDARRAGSPETRQVLDERRESDAGEATANDVNGMMSDGSSDGRPCARGGRELSQAKQDGKGFPRGPGAQIPGFGRPVNLQGFPQVVGLALGAPEFQRR